MTDRVLEFTVVGIAIPKGSTRAFVIKGKNGAAPRAITTAANKKTHGWQQTIANCAALELTRAKHADCRFFQSEPIALNVVFYLPRPKALLTRRLASQDVPHTKKPDLDKLARACKDALTGVVWTDDAQVVDLVARKRYCAAGENPRAIIRVRSMAAAPEVPDVLPLV